MCRERVKHKKKKPKDERAKSEIAMPTNQPQGTRTRDECIGSYLNILSVA